MNYPTIDNPLVLVFTNDISKSRSIPSLKNRRQPFVNKKGKLLFRKNPEVLKFLKSLQPKLLAQWEQTDFDTMGLPHRVGVYTEVVKYVTDPETVVPTSDLDNQFTTVQESLFVSGDKTGIPVMEDDRQVAFFAAEERLVSVRHLQHAVCYIWKLTDAPYIEQLYELYTQQIKEHEPAPQVTLPTLLQKE